MFLTATTSSIVQALGGTSSFSKGQAAEDSVLEDEGQGCDEGRNADDKNEPEHLRSEGQCYKTFYVRNLRIFVIRKTFLPILMCVGNARKRCHDTQDNDTQQNDTQYNDIVVMPSVIYAKCRLC